VLFWCTVGATVLLAVAAWNRLRVWDDFKDGARTVLEVDDADGALAAAVGLQFLLLLAGAIVLSIWSLRTARNARSRGAAVSPGLACGSWYIPFGWFVVPFIQLRHVLRHGGRSTAALNWWQGLFIAAGVAFALIDAGNPEIAESVDDVSGRLQVQIAGAVASAVLLAAAAAAATRAMRQIDDA
jgi:hypothetical protein